MSQPLTPFQIHLTYFSTTPTPNPSAEFPRITLLSGLRRSLALGLDFPVALLTTVSLRLLYGSPWTLYLRPVSIRHVTIHRTMLEDVNVQYASLSPGTGPSTGVGRHELMSSVRMAGLGLVDQVHAWGLHAVSAGVGGNRDGILTKNDVEMARQGRLMWDVERRRRYRSGAKGEVLPLSRGGPISVVGHSWFVDKLFGVKVYQLPNEGDASSDERTNKKTR